MARLDTLLGETRAGIPGAPDPVLLRALRNGAEELCRQSQCWQEQLDPIQMQAGVFEYDLSPPAGTRVERIVWAKYNGRLMDWNVRDRDLMAQTASTGAPRAISLSPSTATFHVHPTPRENDTANVDVYAVLVPLPNATSVADHIINKYRRGIIAIAKAQLMALSPGMPYHNPQMAAVQADIGNEWIVRAKREQHSGGHVPMRVAPRPFV